MRNAAREHIFLWVATIAAGLSITIGLWEFWLSGAVHQIVIGCVMLLLVALTWRLSRRAADNADQS